MGRGRLWNVPQLHLLLAYYQWHQKPYLSDGMVQTWVVRQQALLNCQYKV